MRELGRQFLRKLIRGYGTLRAEIEAGSAGEASVVPAPRSTADLMTELYESLTQTQRQEVCFDWGYLDPERGLLRSFIANHWQVTRPCVRSCFFTEYQKAVIETLFKTLIDPAWHDRFFSQLRDDTNGHLWGADQSIALFGKPANGPFQFLITGRHLTLRGDARSDGSVAFGGPILYGHAATGYHEPPNHPGNIFWQQAVAAGQLYDMLDDEQRERALLSELPDECAIGFRAARPGLPADRLTSEQARQLERTLAALLAPFRVTDRQRVHECLAAQGGLASCNVTFYRQGRLSPPLWDNWRLEGPSFVWYFRGVPHVHGWVHVAKDSAEEVNARTGTFIFPHHDPLL
jgi:hypothetical protein